MPIQTHDIPALAAEFTAVHPDLDPSQQRCLRDRRARIGT